MATPLAQGPPAPTARDTLARGKAKAGSWLLLAEALGYTEKKAKKTASEKLRKAFTGETKSPAYALVAEVEAYLKSLAAEEPAALDSGQNDGGAGDPPRPPSNPPAPDAETPVDENADAPSDEQEPLGQDEGEDTRPPEEEDEEARRERRRKELEREEALRMGAEEKEDGTFTFVRPYAVINGATVPLPLEDIDIDEEGNPLSASVTLRVALGVPKIRFRRPSSN